MPIINGKFVFYDLVLNNGQVVRMQDCARTDVSEYPKVAVNIRPYDEYELIKDQLKPCPFCGSDAEKIQIALKHKDFVPPLWSGTKCSNKECLCSFKSVDAKIWNTRYSEQWHYDTRTSSW